MPKRRIDDASQDLIDELREQDEFEQAMETFENERASILISFESKKEEIESRFKKPLSERDQIRYDTDIGYQETLKKDRLSQLEDKINTFRTSHDTSIRSRKRQRVLDRDIREYEAFLEMDCTTCDWRILRKSRHVQKKLGDAVDEMSLEQKNKYTAVLNELRNKGWRTLFKVKKDKVNGPTTSAE